MKKIFLFLGLMWILSLHTQAQIKELSTTERPPVKAIQQPAPSEKPNVKAVQQPTEQPKQMPKEVPEVPFKFIKSDSVAKNTTPKTKKGAFVKGTAFALTGFTATPQDTAKLHGFKYCNKKDLSEAELKVIQSILNDTLTVGKPSLSLGVFMPKMAFFVEDSEGQPMLFFISADEFGDIAQGYVALRELNPDAYIAFDTLAKQIFYPNPNNPKKRNSKL